MLRIDTEKKAGAELFTGNNFVMSAGVFGKTVTLAETIKLWLVCYIGNWILNSTRGNDRFEDYDQVQEKLFDNPALVGAVENAAFAYRTDFASVRRSTCRSLRSCWAGHLHSIVRRKRLQPP